MPPKFTFDRTPKHYKVVLLAAPGMDYAQIENAQSVLRESLNLLNSHELEPGFRFADHITGELSVETDQAALEKRLKKEGDIALVIVCGQEPKDLKTLATLCTRKNAEFCHARPIPPGTPIDIDKLAESFGDDPQVMPMRFLSHEESKRRARGLPGHSIALETLTESVDTSPEAVETRINKLISVLALSVMTSHTMRNPHNIG